MKRILSMVAVVLVVFAGAAFANEKAAEKAAPKHITLEDLKALKDAKKDFVLIDSRGGKYFDGEMIEGAVNLPVDKTTAESLAKIAPKKDTPLVFYCTDTACNASELAAYKALAAGYTNVSKVPDGIEGWKKKGWATTKPKN
ncbi:MAG: hypothetical protein EB060_05835 [Proteobacteria bacterium]|nr:hypothetical protein [Pseudomonadota bacterium]